MTLPLEWVESPPAMSVAEAGEYCAKLANSHYENFHVATFFLPKDLHQDFYNLYAYCRWSDDLADEIGDPAESLRLLAWWRMELDAMYAGRVVEQGTCEEVLARPAHP